MQVENLQSPDVEIIERDLHRTFPDNIHFRSNNAPDGGRSRSTEVPMITALRRVLRAFSVHNPKIGYCQSLNFLAGLLLLFMDEEKAFWMLVIITERLLPGVHEVSLEGVNVDQGVLMLCVKDSLPKLWNKIGVNFEGEHYNNILTSLPPITLCTAAWFMSGYIGILPIETTLRVWDILFLEGSKTFFRIAMTLFKLAEPAIEKIYDPMEIFQVVQTLPKRVLDANMLIVTCFKRRSNTRITEAQIASLRAFVRERRSSAIRASLHAATATAQDLSQTANSEARAARRHDFTGNASPAAGPTPAKSTSNLHARALQPLGDDLREYQAFKHSKGFDRGSGLGGGAGNRSTFGLSKRMRSIKKT